jgi:hypothetical protein
LSSISSGTRASIVSSACADRLQLGSGPPGDRALLDGQSVELVIVEHHRLAVAAELDVELDAVARDHGCGDGAAAILDQLGPVQAAMGEGDGAEPLELREP